MKLCKCTLQYADRAIERISYGNRIQVQELYQKYPFEQLGESCFKVMRKKFAIYQSSYAYDECYSVEMKAYMYTICQCSLKKTRRLDSTIFVCDYTSLFYLCS